MMFDSWMPEVFSLSERQNSESRVAALNLREKKKPVASVASRVISHGLGKDWN